MSKRHRRQPAWGKIVAIVLACAALAAAWRFTPLSEFITAERIIGWARAVREVKWAPLAQGSCFAGVVLAFAAFTYFVRRWFSKQEP